ncbi:hypothetical protein CC1G_10860 [Coprinopsis cinerea okayama7|uniref:Secreted protein n=1 Tax=Coprinopsis cinerea (strain Okayama-7 / 130 / ATCC MYA-4618 / FGSC 9003) TaxID=240176 RepID=A8NKT8_COPC7|nr:hypothetical protein CC1G_10860 [Coprinopsis cinerea okayama7\|eukprot:XP_001834542.1 hypothetical protein CC1G_10860 [Coprinopsis cinerea okayama7\
MVSFRTAFVSRLLVAALLAFLLGVVDARFHRRAEGGAADLQGLTNAERLARGYPPEKPKRLFHPSNTLVARGAKPSGQPPRNEKRCIKVIKKGKRNGFEVIGYISHSMEAGIYQIKNKKRDCLAVRVPNTDGPFDISIEGANGHMKYLGLAGGSNDSLQASYLVKTAQTPAGSTPKKVGNSANDSQLRFSESAVWSTTGNKLKSVWKRHNGQVAEIRTFIKSSNDDFIYFVHKVDEFTKSQRDEYEVWLELVDSN